MGELIILHYEGKKILTWDSDGPDAAETIDAISNEFDLLIEKGFFALRVDPAGPGGDKIDRFDPSANRIMMFPILIGG